MSTRVERQTVDLSKYPDLGGDLAWNASESYLWNQDPAWIRAEDSVFR